MSEPADRISDDDNQILGWIQTGPLMAQPANRGEPASHELGKFQLTSRDPVVRRKLSNFALTPPNDVKFKLKPIARISLLIGLAAAVAAAFRAPVGAAYVIGSFVIFAIGSFCALALIRWVWPRISWVWPRISLGKHVQPIVISVGALCIVASLLFPPWTYTEQYKGMSQTHKSAGYRFIFTPPKALPSEINVSLSGNKYTQSVSVTGVDLDWSRLILQIIAIGAVTTGAWYLCRWIGRNEAPK